MNSSRAKEQLKEEVKLRIALIGVGNAGNQFINTAFSEGYENVFAVNTSDRDLSDQNINSTIPAFLAGDEARGAGGNRQKAKDLFQVNGRKLFETPRFVNNMQASDIIFVMGSSDGGSGSGIAPEIIRLLTMLYPNKIIIYYGSLPKLSASPDSHNNMINCLHEVNSLKVPYMLADLSFYEDVPNDVAYKHISRHIIDSIDIISGKYLFPTTNNSIDENDMRTIICEPGYMATYIINKITTAQIEKESIQSLMIKQIKNSPAAMIQKDGILKYLGVIVNSPDDMMEASKTGNYSELKAFAGIPRGTFENYSVTQGTVGQFMTILSGMSLPYSRILQSTTIIEEHKAALTRVKPIDLTGDVQKFDFLNTSTNKNKLVDSTKIASADVDSVLGDFFNKK